MTEQESKFLTLFMSPDAPINCGYKWHHDFEEVKVYMEKNHSEMWEGYNKSFMNAVYCGCSASQALSFVLDLSNLVTFLLRPEQVKVWGCTMFPKPFQGLKNVMVHPAAIYAQEQGWIK
jgi:hypothetical protein